MQVRLVDASGQTLLESEFRPAAFINLWFRQQTGVQRDQQLAACQTQRDALATKMKNLLGDAVFGDESISPREAFWLSQRGLNLIWQMDELSRYSTVPTFTVCSSSSWEGHIRR